VPSCSPCARAALGGDDLTGEIRVRAPARSAASGDLDAQLPCQWCFAETVKGALGHAAGYDGRTGWRVDETGMPGPLELGDLEICSSSRRYGAAELQRSGHAGFIDAPAGAAVVASGVAERAFTVSAKPPLAWQLRVQVTGTPLTSPVPRTRISPVRSSPPHAARAQASSSARFLATVMTHDSTGAVAREIQHA